MESTYYTRLYDFMGTADKSGNFKIIAGEHSGIFLFDQLDAKFSTVEVETIKARVLSEVTDKWETVDVTDVSVSASLPYCIQLEVTGKTTAGASISGVLRIGFDAMIDIMNVPVNLVGFPGANSVYGGAYLDWNGGFDMEIAVPILLAHTCKLKAQSGEEIDITGTDTGVFGKSVYGYTLGAIIPNTIAAAGLYTIECTLTYCEGMKDFISNYILEIGYRSSSSLVIDNGNQGDSITIISPTIYDGYEFLHWQSTVYHYETQKSEIGQYNAGDTFEMPFHPVNFYAVYKSDEEPPEPPEPPDVVNSEEGNVFGTGDLTTRYNEISADILARVRNFIIGYESVIFKSEHHDFDYVLSDNNNSVTITDGAFCAYGYVGKCEQATFDILPPAVEQYHLIYAELDRSVIPNICSIKIKNNQSSPYYDTAFRQDVLSEVKTGIYQVPLWRVKVTNNGIDENGITDIRPKILHADGENKIPFGIKNVHNAVDTHKVTGSLEDGVTCVTQSSGNNSTRVASTAFAVAAIRAEINK